MIYNAGMHEKAAVSFIPQPNEQLPFAWFGYWGYQRGQSPRHTNLTFQSTEAASKHGKFNVRWWSVLQRKMDS